MAKVDLITGFLGSGKTTFIINYVRYLLKQGYRVGIIENDYGAINVDMMFLNEEFGHSCGLEMVVAGDLDCRRRRLRTKLIAMGMQKYDRVIVEPSGIYDADEFFDMLHEEVLERWYEIGSVISVIDANLDNAMSKESNYLLTTQVAGAGKIVFSKTQLCDKEDLERTICHINTALEENKCDKRIEIGSDSYISKDWKKLDDEDYEEIMNAGYDISDYVKKHILEENEYGSLFFYNPKGDMDEIKDIINRLFSSDEWGNIYRIKGFVQKSEKEWYSINYTKDNKLLELTENGQGVIIVIGENLNKEKLDELIPCEGFK